MSGEGRDVFADFLEVVDLEGEVSFPFKAGDEVSVAIFWIRVDRRGVEDPESISRCYNMYIDL